MKLKCFLTVIIAGLLLTACEFSVLATTKKPKEKTSQTSALQTQTNIEAKKVAEIYVNKIFVKCGEGGYSKFLTKISLDGSNRMLESRYLEIFDFKLTVSTYPEKSLAERRNGIEAHGVAVISGSTIRTYNLKTRVWSPYEDFHNSKLNYNNPYQIRLIKRKNENWKYEELIIGEGTETPPTCNEVRNSFNAKSLEEELLNEARKNSINLLPEAREEAKKFFDETFIECRPNKWYAKFEVVGASRDYTKLEIYSQGFYEYTGLSWQLISTDYTKYDFDNRETGERLTPQNINAKISSPNLWEGTIQLNAKSFRYFLRYTWSKDYEGVTEPYKFGGVAHHFDKTQIPKINLIKVRKPGDGEPIWQNKQHPWKPMKDCSEIDKLLK